MMSTDRVTRNPKPLTGNQIALALQKALVVPLPKPEPTPAPEPEEEPDVQEAEPVESAPADDAAVLSDLRVWLARLVAGERVPTMLVTDRISEHRRHHIVDRFKTAGFITIVRGRHGGAIANPSLVELARSDISDEELRTIALKDADDLPPTDPVPEDVDHEMSGRPAFLARVRRWLQRGIGGENLQVSQIGNSGNTYTAVRRLYEAGIVDKGGDNDKRATHYVVSDPAAAAALSDEQLYAILWRRAPNEPATDTPELAQVLYPSEPTAQISDVVTDDALTLIAERLMLQLNVLERLDARLARLERELGLPPIEQDNGGP